MGIIIGFFKVAKLMSFLLKKFHDITFFGIIGFIIGSTFALFCNHEIVEYYQVWATGNYIFIPSWLEIIIGVLLGICGFAATFFISRYASKKKQEANN